VVEHGGARFDNGAHLVAAHLVELALRHLVRLCAHAPDVISQIAQRIPGEGLQPLRSGAAQPGSDTLAEIRLERDAEHRLGGPIGAQQPAIRVE